jgi:PKD repeat protein
MLATGGTLLLSALLGAILAIGDVTAVSGAKHPKPTPSPTPPLAPCVTTGPASGAYTVTVCISAPASGATIVGSVPTTATVTSSDPSVGVQRTAFTLDGAQLLTDFTSPYTFTLDARRWVDGTHQLRVSGLMRDGFVTGQAGVSLTFSNGNAKAPTNSNHYTPTSGTTPDPGTPLVLAATGDGAGGEPGEAATVDMVAGWNPNLFLYLGDVYADGTPMEFDNWYGTGGTASTFGLFRSITNPTIGNHEYIGSSASGYFWYWDNIPHYFSFNAGGWHFISLDSTSQYGGMAPGTAQYAWLQQDLAASNAACTIVYYHHPLWNTGPEGSTTALLPIWQLLAQAKVTLVLNGHDHDYQRFAALDGGGNVSANGVTEIIVGSGGHGHQAQVGSDSRLMASNFTSFGALKLSLFQSSASFEFQTTTGGIADSGIVPCRNTADTVAPSAPAGFTVNASGPGQIDLAWDAATDNVGIAGYEVFRDGGATPVASLTPDARAYQDSPVAPLTTHSYSVRAYDAAGNRSPLAGPLSATTPDGTVTIVLKPVADAYVSSAKSTTNYGNSTVLRVKGGSSTYKSYLRFDLSGVPGSIQSATLRAYVNSGSSVGYDLYGVSSTSWGEATINYANAPPFAATPTGSSGALTSGTWSSIVVTGLAASSQGGLLSLGLGNGGTQQSLASRETATPPELILTIGSGSGAPPVAGFNASPSSPIAGSPVALTDTSTGGPTGWSWTFGDGASSTAQNPSHTWTAAGTYDVTLVASNFYGASPPATVSITVTPDGEAPTTPGNLTATAVGPTEIDLAWSTSTDNIAVTGYVVYRDGGPTPLATLGPSATSYHDIALGPGTTASYTVEAVDGAGNHSVAAGPVTATTSSGSVTLTLHPVADAYVDSGDASNNFGNNIALRVSGTSSRYRDSYLRFDLSGVAGAIQSATLRVYANSSSSAGYTAWGVADNSWSEGAITYDNAPSYAATAVGSSGGVIGGSWTTVDIATLVAAGSGGPMSLVLRSTGSQLSLGSRESVTPPELVIVIGP